MIAIFLRDLQQPEYIHVLINPLPVYGLAGWLIGLICLGTGGYIAYAGGRIRHREFRTESPPTQLSNQTAVAAPVASPSGGVARAAAQVTMQTLKYSPETIEIKRGETVEWQNNDL